MLFPALITTDLHLIDSPDCEYRWTLFKWLNEQIKQHGVKSVRILGDLTDAKDRHAASLVNRVVRAVDGIACNDVTIMAGNHDWLIKGQEFFRFLNQLPHVRFITAPREDSVPGEPVCMYLPYSKTPAKDWENLSFAAVDYLFLHQTITGARASNGEVMEGEALPKLDAGRVYSGDIHVPQTINGVTYIGSPYHVHFGDNFQPRVLLLNAKGEETWLHFPTIKRVTIRTDSLSHLRRQKLDRGDQVKLVMSLSESDKHAWAAIKRDSLAYLDQQGVEVHGVELKVVKANQRIQIGTDLPKTLGHNELVMQFVEREGLTGSVFDAAMDVIES